MRRAGVAPLAPLALLAIVAVFAPDVRARADEPAPIRHVVQPGDSCGSIAQRYYGDSRYAELLHDPRANPALARTPPPHVLVPGTIVVVPPKPSPRSGPDAALTAVHNDVEVLAPERKPGKPNDPLFRGNRVSTEAASAADVTFRDETQVKLGERTLVVILGDKDAAAARVPGATETDTQLVTGNLRAFMAGERKDGVASVATDAAQVKVYDGEAQVSSDSEEGTATTRLAVYAGSSSIEAQGRREEVARGFGSKAERGRAPTPPRRLPRAPSWSPAPPLVVVDRGAPTMIADYDVLDARTPAVAPAPASTTISAWHVEIARDGIFRDVAVDARVPAAVRHLEAHAPGPGRYYLRVSAIDDDGFEGPFGPIARVLVLRAEATTGLDGARRLVIAPPDAFCVRVGNVPLTRIEGSAVVSRDARDRAPIRLRCAPSELDPTTLVAVPLD